MSLLIRGLKELERSYREMAAVTGKAEARALNRVATTITAQQSRAIAQVVNLKVSVIKAKIVNVQRATDDSPRIVFEVVGEGIALREFGARQTRAGVSVLVLKGGGRKIVPGAFMAKGFGGNLQVFKRTGQAKRIMAAGRYKGKLREPIEKLFGPSVLSQYVKDAIQQVGADTWNTRLPIELERETTFALQRAGLI